VIPLVFKESINYDLAVLDVPPQHSSVFTNMMQLWRVNDSSFNFRVFNKQFVGLGGQGTQVRADSNAPGDSETFQIIRNDGDPNRVRIKATNGLFLQVLPFLLNGIV
jgi:hypothetical protein